MLPPIPTTKTGVHIFTITTTNSFWTILLEITLVSNRGHQSDKCGWESPKLVPHPVISQEYDKKLLEHFCALFLQSALQAEQVPSIIPYIRRVHQV